MGLNVNLTKMLGLKDTIECLYCHKKIPSHFDDYDIECGDPNPEPAVWNLHVYCEECDKDFYAKVYMKVHIIQCSTRSDR